MSPAARTLWMPLAAAMAALGAFGVWALRSFDPNGAASPFMPCILRSLTGWYCPGCGTTRALHALVHGDLAGVFAMNPLLPFLAVTVPMVVWQGTGRRLPGPRWIGQALGSATFWLVLIGAYWVLRNVPLGPFAWLAPG